MKYLKAENVEHADHMSLAVRGCGGGLQAGVDPRDDPVEHGAVKVFGQRVARALRGLRLGVRALAQGVRARLTATVSGM